MEITEHQANMFRALADGKRLQVVDKAVGDYAFDLTTLDNFMLFITDADRYEVRIKPDVIVVNGIEVPAPETANGVHGDKFYFPDASAQKFYGAGVWGDGWLCKLMLERGLVYARPEDAAARCKAMLAHKPG